MPEFKHGLCTCFTNVLTTVLDPQPKKTLNINRYIVTTDQWLPQDVGDEAERTRITSLGYSMLIVLMVVMFLDVHICQNLSTFTFQKCIGNCMSVIPYKPAKKK